MKQLNKDLSLRTICQVLPALKSGGVERGTVDIDKALRHHGWQSLVVSAGGPMTKQLVGTHHTLPVGAKNPADLFRSIRALEQLIRTEKIDLLHARSRWPAWICFYLAKRLKIPFVTTYHGTYNSHSALKTAYNSVMARGDKVIATSEGIRSHILKSHPWIDPLRIEVIHRGVDIHTFDPKAIPPETIHTLRHRWGATTEKSVILLPGRITRWKGQHLLLEALRHPALVNDKKLVVVLMGDGQSSDYGQSLKKEIEHYNLPVIFEPHGSMQEAIAACDVMVSASTDPEAFGRVMAEAQAMERLVIASDHGGAQEIILPEETGWLIPPASSSALALALRHFMDTPLSTRLPMEKKARQRVLQYFTLDQMAQKTLAIYEEILAKKK